MKTATTKCTCPKARLVEQQYSYYCDVDEHRRLAAGRKDSFTSRLKRGEGTND
jgi:hypothetical protein